MSLQHRVTTFFSIQWEIAGSTGHNPFYIIFYHNSNYSDCSSLNRISTLWVMCCNFTLLCCLRFCPKLHYWTLFYIVPGLLLMEKCCIPGRGSILWKHAYLCQPQILLELTGTRIYVYWYIISSSIMFSFLHNGIHIQ